MNGSKKRATAGVEDSGAPRSDPLGGKRRDVHRDLTNLASQVQMMSDSLAACKQMSKARPLRKMYCVKADARTDVAAGETSVQVLLSPEERALDNGDEEDEQVIVSYMVGESHRLWKSESDGTEGRQQQSWGRRGGSVASAVEEWLEVEKGSSKIRMYEHGAVEASRVIDVIRRELRALREMAPQVALLATALSDTICHYKECDRCNKKISPSLPWILNRIQKLIKYVTTQRLGSYRWPDDYHYLRLRPPDPAAPPLPPPPGPERLRANADQLDAASAAEDIPGLQLLLEVSPGHASKKLFQKADNRPVAPTDSFRNYSVLHLRQPQSQPLVQVLLPGRHPAIQLQEKREAVALREFAHAPRLVFAFRLSPSASLLLASPVGSLTRTRRPPLPLPTGGPGQERSLRPRKKSPEGPPHSPRQGQENTVRQTETLPKRSNANDPSSPRYLLARVPEIVKDFLREAEEERMHDQKVRNLEAGAKGLRDLMTEVHRNQLELSKVLLEKGVYPQPIIKLTDPEMLEKETEVMRRVAEFQGPGPNSVSLEALQTALDDLKHKCALKNRVILIILKGLRSNIPKEWWEDMVEYVFEERRPVEDLGPEKVGGGSMGPTPGPPGNEEQASKQEGRPLRAEEQPSEEEASVRGSVGADVEECLEKLWKWDGVVAKRKVVTSEGLSEGESPGGIGTSIRKLEKQISLLNAENERLKHEVEDLKNLLRSSVDQLRDRRVSRVEWDHRPSGRAPGKTINLTIEIVDKEHRPTRDAARPRNLPAEGATGRARSLALKYRDADSSSGPADSDTDEGEPEQELGRVSPVRAAVGAESCRNSAEELGAGPRERAPGAAASGQASGQEAFRKPKPAGPGACEVSDGRVAGPSRRAADVGRLLQKPSVMELAESECPGTMVAMANERELQTIPENEGGPSASSKGLSQAIQRLRSRVRSIHKDVTVLKSKNDRIDKLLDRLMEDALENGEGFEEMESKLNRLKEQLG